MNITLFRIRRTEIRLNILTVPVIFFCICAGMTKMLIITLFALSLHEFCHTLTAARLNVEIKTIDVTPSGFSASYNESHLSFPDIIGISSAGVIFSLLSGLAYVGFSDLFNVKSSIPLDFARVSIVLGCINILPVIPLDGGRMLHAALHSFLHEKAADFLSAFVGIIISSAALLLSICGIKAGILNYSAVCISALMLAGTVSQIFRRKKPGFLSLMALSDAVLSGNRLSVGMHAFSGDVHISQAMSSLDGGRYNYIAVIGSDLNTVGILDEFDLYLAMSEGCATLYDALKIKKSPNNKMLYGH